MWMMLDGGSGDPVPELIFAWIPNMVFLKVAIPDYPGSRQALTQSATPAAAMSRARWVGERTVDTVTVPVPMQVALREATIEEDIR